MSQKLVLATETGRLSKSMLFGLISSRTAWSGLR